MPVIKKLQVACIVGYLCFILLSVSHKPRAATVTFTLTTVLLFSMLAVRAVIKQSSKK